MMLCAVITSCPTCGCIQLFGICCTSSDIKHCINSNVNIYIYMCIYMYVIVCNCIYVYMHICIYVYVYMYMYIYIYMYVCVSLYPYLDNSGYMCVSNKMTSRLTDTACKHTSPSLSSSCLGSRPRYERIF